ncbi:RNA ligase [Actinomadura viridis]|uniref:RNA ligase n=1 Tax=Actinomadura viridis TaxID=58110 RepID=UPI003684F03B
MSPHISDLFDLTALNTAIAEGHVREQHHPTLPLRILNYTERCQYERAWTNVTLNCRGLITHHDGHIIARPWRKFFNYGELACGTLDLDAKAETVDKIDGSLGTLYPHGDGWAIATRGSFTSTQAEHATRILRDRYASFRPPDGVTVLIEIVYPANRIVCDYGDTDDLILLGAVHTATGTPLGPDHVPNWPGPRAETFPASTLGKALTLPPRPGAEGVVVRLIDTGTMVKIKQEDYVRLHRIVTGLNARAVWEALGDGQTVADICEPLPDEFHAWVRDLNDRLGVELHNRIAAAETEHTRILNQLPAGWTRKDYAALAVKSPYKAWLFLLLDGKDPAPKIWQTLRPSGEDRPITVSEDVA